MRSYKTLKRELDFALDDEKYLKEKIQDYHERLLDVQLDVAALKARLKRLCEEEDMDCEGFVG